MIYPSFLNKANGIGVTAPSEGANDEIDIRRLNFAVKNIQDKGLNVITTSDCFTTDGRGRSSDKFTRAKEFNSLIKNNDVSAIIGMAGGEFLLEVLEYIDFEELKKNPKWVQGYSDITGLLFPITTNLDIATIYANNFKGFAMKEWHKSLIDNLEILQGNIIEQGNFEKYENERTEKTIGNESYVLSEYVRWQNLLEEDEINIEGRMIGGCLDIIMNLVGTKFDKTNEFIEKYKDDGIIWFFDNCEISSEEFIRAMWQLKNSGYFKYTNGIVFGRPGLNQSYLNIPFKDAVKDSLGELKIPIILDMDFGHKPPMLTIINGAIGKIHSKDGKGRINFILE